MSENDRRGTPERPPGTRDTKLVYRYEDGYDAEIHPSFESLSEQFAAYAEASSQRTTSPSAWNTKWRSKPQQ